MESTQPKIEKSKSYLNNYIKNTISKMSNGERVKIVGYGDSITWGFTPFSGKQVSKTYIGELQSQLRDIYANTKISVVNRGTPGWRSNEGLNFFDMKVLSENPDLVLIMFGINDCRGHGKYGPIIPVDVYKNNISQMVLKAKQNGIDIILLSPTPIIDTTNNNNNRLINYVIAVKEVADDFKVPFINLHSEFNKFFTDYIEIPDHLLPDNVHLKEDKYRLIAHVILNHIEYNQTIENKINNYFDHEKKFLYDETIVKYRLLEGNINKLIIIFAPYIIGSKSGKSTEHNSGFKFYPEIEKSKANILYIRDNFGVVGGFNIMEDGNFFPEHATINLIRNIQEILSISNENTILFGERKGGLTSLYFGHKYNYNYISLYPLIDLDNHYHNRNLISKNAVFSNKKEPADILKFIYSSEFKENGLFVHSHYDEYQDSYNESLVTYLESHSKVTVSRVEDHFMADSIKQNMNKLIFPYIFKYINDFIFDNLDSKFKFIPKRPEEIKQKIYEKEKVYHTIINGKNRVVKYWETKKHSDIIIFAFNPIITLESEHDVKSAYAYKFLNEFDASIINIRDSFGINGGWYIQERGDQYPEKVVAEFMEFKCKEYGVSKKNVILFGCSKGGFSSIYFAKKYGFEYIFTAAPIIEPHHLISKKLTSILGIPVKREYSIEDMESISKRHLNDYTDVIQQGSNIHGTIWYTEYDEMPGTKISDEFINNHPHLDFYKLEDLVDIEVDKIAHGKVAELLLPKIKKNIHDTITSLNKKFS